MTDGQLLRVIKMLAIFDCTSAEREKRKRKREMEKKMHYIFYSQTLYPRRILSGAKSIRIVEANRKSVSLNGRHFQQTGHQPGMVDNHPARGQLNKEKVEFSLSPFAPENLVSRVTFGCPVLRQAAYSPHPG